MHGAAPSLPFLGETHLWSGIRTADDKVLLRWWDGFEEVYDLHTDPQQLDGGVSPAERRYVARLRAGLDRLDGCIGSACSSVHVLGSTR